MATRQLRKLFHRITLSTPATSIYDKIWQFANWYENGSNPVVQEVLFSGRYQHEYNALWADQGNNSEWNVRRMRLGPKVTMFRDWLVHAEVELNPEEAAPVYTRITDFYVQWTQSEAFGVKVPKQRVICFKFRIRLP